MSDALQITSYARSPTNDVEESPVPFVPEKETWLPSVFSRLVSTLKTVFRVPSATHDAEGSPSVAKTKALLSFVLSWPDILLRRFPFLLSTIVSAIIAGSVAGVLYRPYYLDAQIPFGELRTEHGVSGATFEVWTDAMYHRLHFTLVFIS